MVLTTSDNQLLVTFADQPPSARKAQPPQKLWSESVQGAAAAMDQAQQELRFGTREVLPPVGKAKKNK